MCGGNRHAFGTVHGRAATHSDQTVAAAGLVQICGSADGGFGRVRRGLVKNSDRHAR